MTAITLRVLDGADRGRVFENLVPPITIGREEGNCVQLNDERVSRYHLKIQEDNDRLVLTDLESTNGTRVNGEDIQLRILRYGDMISLGRTVLLFGSREQIASRMSKLRGADGANATVDPDELNVKSQKIASQDFDLNLNSVEDLQATMFSLEPPELPTRMSPAQAAQLAELLEYLHIRVRGLLTSASQEAKAERIVLDQRQWQYLLDIQSRLAEYLRGVGDPNSSL